MGGGDGIGKAQLSPLMRPGRLRTEPCLAIFLILLRLLCVSSRVASLLDTDHCRSAVFSPSIRNSAQTRSAGSPQPRMQERGPPRGGGDGSATLATRSRDVVRDDLSRNVKAHAHTTCP